MKREVLEAFEDAGEEVVKAIARGQPPAAEPAQADAPAEPEAEAAVDAPAPAADAAIVVPPDAVVPAPRAHPLLWVAAALALFAAAMAFAATIAATRAASRLAAAAAHAESDRAQAEQLARIAARLDHLAAPASAAAPAGAVTRPELAAQLDKVRIDVAKYQSEQAGGRVLSVLRDGQSEIATRLGQIIERLDRADRGPSARLSRHGD